MIDPPLAPHWLLPEILKISPEILKFRFSLHMVKDDWPPTPLASQWSLPKILKFRFSLHMVKDDWSPLTQGSQKF